MNTCVVTKLLGSVNADLPILKDWVLIRRYSQSIVQGQESSKMDSGLKKTDFSDDTDYCFIMEDENGVVAEYNIMTSNGKLIMTGKTYLPNEDVVFNYSEISQYFKDGDLYVGSIISANNAIGTGTVIVSVYKAVSST